MRELNPRAWSIDGQCWCTRVDYDGYKEEWSGIVPVLAPDNRSKRIGEVEDTNIIVEFPTGLKDKNGKEVYEGDIVRYGRHLSGIIPPESRTAVVKWWSGEEEYYPCCTSSGFSLPFSEDGYEVIGNIHENPELLEANDVD